MRALFPCERAFAWISAKRFVAGLRSYRPGETRNEERNRHECADNVEDVRIAENAVVHRGCSGVPSLMQKRSVGVWIHATDDVCTHRPELREILPPCSPLPSPCLLLSSLPATKAMSTSRILSPSGSATEHRAACVQAAASLYDTDPRTTNLYDRLSKTYLLG